MNAVGVRNNGNVSRVQVAVDLVGRIFPAGPPTAIARPVLKFTSGSVINGTILSDSIFASETKTS